MAGDWIKMGTGLRKHPKVVRISSALKADRLRTVGGLHAVWSLFDEHSEDGLLVGYTPQILDEELAWPGFSVAMMAVEWLIDDGESLSLPRFDAHNGQSAKRRAMEADRKRTVRKVSAVDADKKRTREEKRREEIKAIPLTPAVAGGDTGKKPRTPRAKVTFPTFTQACRDAGEKPVPPGDPIFTFAADVGIPKEYLELCWREFARKHRDSGRMQKDWRAHFRDAVRRNWFKLWWFPSEGACDLTTAGVQLKRERDAEHAQREDQAA